MLELVFALIATHFICDFTLQTESQALGKNFSIDKARFGVNWQYWMFSHAVTHGAAISLVTGSIFCGIFETVAHFIIDSGKCGKRYGIHTDQFAHFACKVFYFAILAEKVV